MRHVLVVIRISSGEPVLLNLGLFIPTFLAVSLTPGMCMTLALSLGMTIGVRKTLWMMLGELAGVATVVLATIIGVAALFMSYPALFVVLKWGGGLYLGYLGVQLCLSKGRLAIRPGRVVAEVSIKQLITQGFVTAIANPKGWAFLVALLPPFIDQKQALLPQASLLLVCIIVIEFLALLLYATSGKALVSFLQTENNLKWLNRVAGGLMLMVAVGLILT